MQEQPASNVFRYDFLLSFENVKWNTIRKVPLLLRLSLFVKPIANFHINFMWFSIEFLIVVYQFVNWLVVCAVKSNEMNKS